MRDGDLGLAPYDLYGGTTFGILLGEVKAYISMLECSAADRHRNN